MRVHVVDPSAYTPPYDHALCQALAAQPGVEVELFTSRFAYGEAPAPEGYARHESFYRLAHRAPAAGRRSRARLALKLAEHVPDMLRYRRAALAADVAHFQWLTVQPLDVHLLPRRRPTPAGPRPALVLTAHDVLPREPRPGQLAAQRRLYQRMDAVVVHSEHGRARLVGELGLPPALVEVIPHGVLRPSGGASASPEEIERALPAELRGVRGPVALFFGLLRPYKGLDVLLRAWGAAAEGQGGSTPGTGREEAGVRDAELWIVGMPRMDVGPLLEAAERSCTALCGAVRVVPRFVDDAEAGALLRRASLVVAPYREIDQSGVAFTALGAGTPLLLSDVGGFPEIAACGAARTVPVGDAAALRAELIRLLGAPQELREMARAAAAAAAGRYSWDAIAQAHVGLYRRLLT